jgi:hypothetical protein
MTLAWSSSTDIRLSLLQNLPNYLQVAINKVWQQHYEELYESEADGTASLQDALDEVLQLFQGSPQTLCHLRYVWMALILALVVQPTIEYYQPHNSIPRKTISQISFWLLETLGRAISPESQSAENNKTKLPDATSEVLNLFSDKRLESFQVLYEALDVYKSAILTLKPNQSLEALFDILDDILEGYAIFPGSYGRRELFDWWLLDVVPATWYLRPPNSIYVIDELPNKEDIKSHQISTLEQISAAMWSFILEGLQNEKGLKSRSFHSTYDSSYLKNVGLDIKIIDNEFNSIPIVSPYKESIQSIYPI